MEDINFNFSYVRPEKMTKFEIAILNGVISGSNDDIDAMELLEYLYRMNLVDKTFYQDFRERASKLNWNRPQLIEYLLLKIQPFCSLSTLINALRELGYHHISTELMKGLLLPKSSVERVNRNDMSNRKQVQQFFKMLKRKVWNAEFEEPLKTLRSMAVKLKFSMQAQTDPLKRQLLADRVVAVLGAEIDAHAITFDAELSEHDLFKELRDIVPQTTNTLVTDVILFGRQANACAIGKYFSLGEKCLQRAKGCSAFMAPCLELANMVYCEVYVRLWEYEQNPKKAIRESLVKMAEIGIECLRDEEEEIRMLWTRMFLLRMIFCLLGIGNRANIIPNCFVTMGCIKKARAAFCILNETLDGMDKRRKMFYFTASARLKELEGNLQLAREDIKMSSYLASEGKFKEIHFICQYMQTIELLLTSQSSAFQPVLSGDTSTECALKSVPFLNPSSLGNTCNAEIADQLDVIQHLTEGETDFHRYTTDLSVASSNGIIQMTASSLHLSSFNSSKLQSQLDNELLTSQEENLVYETFVIANDPSIGWNSHSEDVTSNPPSLNLSSFNNQENFNANNSVVEFMNLGEAGQTLPTNKQHEGDKKYDGVKDTSSFEILNLEPVARLNTESFDIISSVDIN